MNTEPVLQTSTKTLPCLFGSMHGSIGRDFDARIECPRQPLAVSSATSIYTHHQFPWRQSGNFCSPLFYTRSALRRVSFTTPLHSTTAASAAAMEVQRKNGALLASFLLASLASQAFVAVVESARSSPMEKASQVADDVKKPDCVPGLDPRTFPGHGGTTTPLPSHGGSGTTPSHGGSGTSPSHGGGYGTTPAAPSHGGYGTTPSPSHGGYGTSPTTPSHGGYGTSPTTPSHGGYGTSPTAPPTGGGYGSSPTPSHGGAYGSSPTPSHGGYGGTTPSYGGSPTTPSHGGHGTATPTPLIPVDPNSPGTCDYWRTHPMEIWSAIGRWPSSVGHFFGTAGSSAAGGTDVSIQDALGNTRADGASALLREGTAALLNSMTRVGFPYTTEQVRQAFAAAAGSDSAAATQAAEFKKANKGKL